MPGPFNTALIALFNGYNSRIYNTGDPNEITSARLMLADANALPDIGSPTGTTTQFGTGVSLDSVGVVRKVSPIDTPCLGAGLTVSPVLQFPVNPGEWWIVDAAITFRGVALYVAGLTVALNTPGSGPAQEVYSGPGASNLTTVTYPNRVSNAGSGTFATFDLKADLNNATINVRAAYVGIGLAGIISVQFAPVVAGAGNITLVSGSNLVAYRVQ